MLEIVTTDGKNPIMAKKAYLWQKNKVRWFYNYGNDVAHAAQCQEYIDTYDDCEWLTDWAHIKTGDDLIIAGHGDGANPNTIEGTDAAGTRYQGTFQVLADFVANGINNAGLDFQVKLYMCTSADKKLVPGAAPSGIEILGHRFFEDKRCFAGQFMSAMKQHGYTKIKVAAYHGELHWAQGLPNKVVCTAPVNPLTHTRADVPRGIGVLVVFKRKYGAARHRREWFTDNFFGTRWL
jgi:hypothetical protein